jgi:rubrerythrin
MRGVADIRVHGVTRSAFLARGVLAAGALYGAGAAGPAITRALAHEQHGAFSGGDIGIVNFALTLERIENDFYKAVLGGDLDAEAKKLIEAIQKHEDEHVKSLTQSIQQLGGKAAPPVKATFETPTSQADVLRVAIELEDTGVSAYNGAATRIQSTDVLQAIGSIAQVEGRHAGALRQLAGETPTVGPFDRVFSGEQADAALHELTS